MRKSFLVSLLLTLTFSLLNAGIEEIVPEREGNIIRLFIKGDFEYEVLKLPPPEKGLVVYIKSKLPDQYKGKSYTFSGVNISTKSEGDETRIYLRSSLDFDSEHYKAGDYLVVSMTLKGRMPPPPKPKKEKTVSPPQPSTPSRKTRPSARVTKPAPSGATVRKTKGAYYLKIRGAKEELVLKALSMLEGKITYPRDPEKRIYVIAKGLSYEEALRLIFSQ